MTMDHSDLGRDALLDRIDDCDDAAAKFGARETWNGDAVQVVRDAQGRFVTWRAATPPTTSTSRAVADGGREEVSWTTDKGTDVTAWAESGTLFASVSLDALQIEIDQTSAQIREINGMDALYLGIRRVEGDRRKLWVPTDGRVDELEQLREASIDTSTRRHRDEKEQDALDEAAETGEEVVISRFQTDCNDPRAECNLDYVTRVASPDGEIETRRRHTC